MRDIEKDAELCAKRTPGPVKWQRFGKQYYLTGQYGMRPIIFGTVFLKGGFTNLGVEYLSNRDAETDLLIPLDPKHPDSRFIEEAWDALPWYIGEVKRLREENAALEKCAEYRRKEAEHNQEAGCRYMYENDKLRAENQRLKSVVELVKQYHVCIPGLDDALQAYEEASKP